ARGSRQQRPPHDRGRLQGLRPRAAPGGRDRPDRDRRPEHEGDADRMSTQIGIVDYGMGNRRSVEKALAHVGASPVLSSDPELLASLPGLVLPGVGAFPRAMENLRSLGLVE